ncbi:hypothetical protein SOPP22_19025 [Shewanella sp. OPT22]|nr:hypothetical protein SOPP22_19025 [Shewanella sp. OPT22]
MFKQISKNTLGLVGSTILISGMSMSAQASDVNTDIVTSLERTMAVQTAKLIEVAKKEVMLSFEAQLAEMMNELSIKADVTENQDKAEVANNDKQEDQNNSDIE